MTQGLLAKNFTGVAVKRLSAVEANPNSSNQHEFNGVTDLKRILGATDRKKFHTRFIWLGSEQEAISGEGFLTWYDARLKHKKRSEYRLYFPTTEVSELASEGDTVFIATCPDGSMMVIVTPAYSTMENQVAWLFGVQNQLKMKFSLGEIKAAPSGGADFAVRYVLEELGLEPEEPETGHLDIMLNKFDKKLPTTKDFSKFVRSTLDGVNARDDPDAALMAWIDREYLLFRRFERYIVEDRLRTGFSDSSGVDVNGFLKFSISVQNRRKSRMGQALENHLEEVFRQKSIRHVRGATTENRTKPDFLFPGIEEYRDETFPDARLAMLGAKSTCKDRWRQILSEAGRIQNKHLFTLEPGISKNQTTEMQSSDLQLVLPRSLHATYLPDQQDWLMNLEEFIELAKGRDSDSNPHAPVDNKLN